MQDWTTARRWQMGAAYAASTGAVIGAMEALWWVSTAPAMWPVLDALLLGGAGALSAALVAGLVALVAGAVHTLRPQAPAHRNVAVQVAAAGSALLSAYLWPWAWDLYAQGRVAPAGVGFVLPIASLAILYLNARYVLARFAAGQATGWGWRRLCAVATAACIGACALVAPLRSFDAPFALDDDRSVLVVSVDGLSHATGVAELQAWRAWAAEGTAFDDAVAPSPSAVATAATLWTGLHPLRHQALDDARALPLGWRTLPERLSDEGFATAAFIASVRMSGVGLDQGFALFDDHAAPGDVTRLSLVPRAWGPAARANEDSVSAYGAWARRFAGAPHLAWVHLVHDASRPEATDAALGTLRALHEAHGRPDDTLVILVGTSGRQANEVGLWDRLVHVPLVVVAPWRDMPATVEVQVRLVDVLNTVMAAMGLDRVDESEGLDLFGFSDGRRALGILTPLVGRNGDGGWLLGMRHQGVKVVLDVDVGEEDLYLLPEDPGETMDRGVEHADTLRKAVDLLGPDRRALDALRDAPDLGPGREALLRALEARP